MFDPSQLKEDVSFSDTNLDGAMIEQASLYAHYSAEAVRAERKVNDQKLRIDVVKSKLDQKIRDDAADDGKKLTEKLVEAEIHRKKEYVDAVKELNALKADAEALKHALEAFRQRRDMLIQIGSSRREEMKGQVRLNDPAEKAAAQKERFANLGSKSDSQDQQISQ